MNLFDIFFGSGQPARRAIYPALRPVATPTKAPAVTPEATLEISKAVRQLTFLDRAYNLAIWSSDDYCASFTHDLELMRAADDLASVTLQLIDRAGAVCGEYRIAFGQGGSRTAHTKVDSGGIEMPVIDRSTVTGKRVIVDRRGNDQGYRSHLKLNWSPAPKLEQRAGDSYASEHAARITGGRETGAFFVAASARHNLVITNATPKGTYAFAKDLDMNRDGIFLLRQHAPNVPFQIGARLTAVIVATPKGLQARAARAAA